MTAFRPFFLFGSFYSILIILLWLFILFDFIGSPFKSSVINWHAYEMVFGFLRAILLGFLFTAGQNWTGKTLLKGKSLQFVTLLWLLGRFTFIKFNLFASISFGIDMMSDVFVLYLLVPVFMEKGQERNRIIVYAYSLLFIFHLFAGLASFQIISENFVLHFVHLAIFIFLLFIILIAGRILPFFTSAVLKEANPKNNVIIEKLIHPLFFFFLLCEFLLPWFGQLRYISALSAFILAIVHFVRLSNWNSLKSFKISILFILHLAYLWLGFGFLFFSGSRMNLFPESSAYHLFTIGAVSTFIYGMITRIPLGHTGRKIIASFWTKFAYLILNIAMFIRVILPVLSFYKASYAISGILWLFAFFIYMIQFTHILIKPRVDGKMG
ncbi:MAG: NnrS family protein [Leptospira sp.]|nr:NnrS family protein [Leptospira sp.]